MLNPHRTYQKSSGIYYIRLLVPKALAGHVKKTKFVYSLETKDRRKAFLLALNINLEFEKWISRMNDEIKRFPALIVENEFGKFEYDISKPEEKEAYENMVDRIGIFKQRKAEPEPSKIPELTLIDAFNSWKASTYKVYSQATQNSYYPKVQLFIEYAKSKKVIYFSEVTSDFAEKYRNQLNAQETKALTVDNHTKSIRRFFNATISVKKYQQDNPFSNLDLIKKSMLQSKTDSYIPFKAHELARLFSLPNYTNRFDKPDLFFGPLIALTMGLRLEEIGQLRVTDIYDLQGLWVIDINDDGDEKELKTEHSRRVIPIPIHMQKTNFLAYHAYVYETFGENSLLFPYLINTKNGFGKTLGYNFTKHKTEFIKVNQEQKTFHSLRKNLGAAIDDKGFTLNLRQSILGHKPESNITNEIYSGSSKTANSKIAFAAEFIYSKLNALEYEFDFSTFQFKFKREDAMMRLMESKAKKLSRNAFQIGKTIKGLDLAAIGSIL